MEDYFILAMNIDIKIIKMFYDYGHYNGPNVVMKSKTRMIFWRMKKTKVAKVLINNTLGSHDRLTLRKHSSVKWLP